MNSTGATSLNGWVRIYNLTFFIGLAVSFSVFWTLSYFFPPSGLGEEAPFVEEVFYGVPDVTLENQEDDEPSKFSEKYQAETTVSV